MVALRAGPDGQRVGLVAVVREVGVDEAVDGLRHRRRLRELGQQPLHLGLQQQAHLLQVALRELADDVRLGREVLVDGADLHVGAARHLAHRQRLGALLDDHVQRHVEDGLDALAAAFLARPAAGLAAGGARRGDEGVGGVRHH